MPMTGCARTRCCGSFSGLSEKQGPAISDRRSLGLRAFLRRFFRQRLGEVGDSDGAEVLARRKTREAGKTDSPMPRRSEDRRDKGSARWVSPRISQRALFSVSFGFVRSCELPPGDSHEPYGLGFLTMISSKQAPRNVFKLPKNLGTKSIF